MTKQQYRQKMRAQWSESPYSFLPAIPELEKPAILLHNLAQTLQVAPQTAYTARALDCIKDAQRSLKRASLHLSHKAEVTSPKKDAKHETTNTSD